MRIFGARDANEANEAMRGLLASMEDAGYSRKEALALIGEIEARRLRATLLSLDNGSQMWLVERADDAFPPQNWTLEGWRKHYNESETQ